MFTVLHTVRSAWDFCSCRISPLLLVAHCFCEVFFISISLFAATNPAYVDCTICAFRMNASRHSPQMGAFHILLLIEFLSAAECGVENLDLLVGNKCPVVARISGLKSCRRWFNYFFLVLIVYFESLSCLSIAVK